MKLIQTDKGTYRKIPVSIILNAERLDVFPAYDT